jgi:hypothetical protein
MDPTEGSETSANINQTLGIHPKVETVNTEHSECLILVMNCSLIIAFVVWCIDCKNLHGMSNVRLVC